MWKYCTESKFTLKFKAFVQKPHITLTEVFPAVPQMSMSWLNVCTRHLQYIILSYSYNCHICREEHHNKNHFLKVTTVLEQADAPYLSRFKETKILRGKNRDRT